jgi:hypothetical protein
MDREGFIDLPFIIMIAHPIWVLTSIYITFALRGAGLGLSRIWSGGNWYLRVGDRIIRNVLR